MTSWWETSASLGRMSGRVLFFVGGAPRSGTTWLQRIVDSHPDACCKGEGLFSKGLFTLLEACVAQRREALRRKNQAVFGDAESYPLPRMADAEFLAATMILLAFQQQAEGRDYRAYGEKTPENVFVFQRYKALFPDAKLLGIARDPRDVLTSSWHYFGKRQSGRDDEAALFDHVRLALPSLDQGARAMMEAERLHPADCHLVTYEQLRGAPDAHVAAVFRFLGLADSEAIVSESLRRTRFEAMTGGRSAGSRQDGSFFRSGVVGDWRSTLNPAMNDCILQALGWMFPHFGWMP